MSDWLKEVTAPRTAVRIDEYNFVVTPTAQGNYACFLSLDDAPDFMSGQRLKALVVLITEIELLGEYTVRIGQDNRKISDTQRVGGYMVYANKVITPNGK